MREGIAEMMLKKYASGRTGDYVDRVVVEEPLHIYLRRETDSGRLQTHLAVTLRTPGQDEELATGYLFSEGIIRKRNDIREISPFSQDSNRLEFWLEESPGQAIRPIQRPTYVSSACGLCGKTGIEDLMADLPFGHREHRLHLRNDLLLSLQAKLKQHQSLFESTGGIHAAALFRSSGELMLVREDVGRHNALDKVIGHCFLQNELPLNDSILLLSGRAGFELIHKAAMAGIPVIASVGAPSSMAIEAAKDMHITLIGFLRDDRFNIYSEFDSFE
jgi:FdhD protein